jgi:hypothetical protein
MGNEGGKKSNEKFTGSYVQRPGVPGKGVGAPGHSDGALLRVRHECSRNDPVFGGPTPGIDFRTNETKGRLVECSGLVARAHDKEKHARGRDGPFNTTASMRLSVCRSHFHSGTQACIVPVRAYVTLVTQHSPCPPISFGFGVTFSSFR